MVDKSDCYDLPCGMSFIRRWTLLKFVPFCPTFLVDVKQGQTTHDDDEANGSGASWAGKIPSVILESFI